MLFMLLFVLPISNSTVFFGYFLVVLQFTRLRCFFLTINFGFLINFINFKGAIRQFIIVFLKFAVTDRKFCFLNA